MRTPSCWGLHPQEAGELQESMPRGLWGPSLCRSMGQVLIGSVLPGLVGFHSSRCQWDIPPDLGVLVGPLTSPRSANLGVPAQGARCSSIARCDTVSYLPWIRSCCDSSCYCLAAQQDPGI